MNDTQLIERLAQADSYSGDAPLPDEIWTLDAALRQIERRTGMETQDRVEIQTASLQKAPRRWIPAAAGVALVAVIMVAVATWTGGSDSSVGASLTPLEVGEALNEYGVAGDWDAARLLYAEGATFTRVLGAPDDALNSPMAEPIDFPDPAIADWDGDGAITLFDDQAQFTKEMYATGVTTAHSCTESNASTVACALLYEGYAFAKSDPNAISMIYTVVDGHITHQEFVGVEVEGHYYSTTLRIEYHDWVRANRSELEDELFRSFGTPSITPDTVETHRELIAEWRSQR
jgi:hypothetical protein